MKAFIQFLTTPTADTPGTTLLLHFDDKRYIIGNVSEGTQRAATQMKARLLKVSDLLITGRTEWSNLGGLIGMILTLADSNAAAASAIQESNKEKSAKGHNVIEKERVRLNMYGAPNLKHTLATCRRYVFRKGMPIDATEFKDQTCRKDSQGQIEPTWQDDHLRIWALVVAPKRKPLDLPTEMAKELQKKAFDEFNGFEDHVAQEKESVDERESRYDRIRQAVVRHMFDSDWSFDTLVEKHITEVELPANMYIRNAQTNRLEPYRGPLPGGAQPVPDITVLTRTPWPGALLQALPPTQPASESISYIVRTHPQRGKFNPVRATELGVPKGKSWAALSNGESVENEKGEMITPAMVLGETRPGTGVAFIDLPSAEYVEPLINREEWLAEDVMQGIGAFIWNLGPGVAADPKLQQFMQKMNKIKHVVSSVDHCANRLSLDSAAASTIRLCQVDSDRYAPPIYDNITIPQARFNTSSTVKSDIREIFAADRGLKINLQPNFEIQKDEITPLLETRGVINGTSQEVINLAEAAREDVRNSKEALEAWKRKLPHPETEVITLGTGSALPSKYRNVSATLLRVPGMGSYLFDCGENTLGQLQRVYNPQQLRDVLKDLRVIWISHLHADHHLGTTSLIKAWYDVVHNKTPLPPNSSPISPNGSKLAVISDQGMLKWLHEYSDVEDFGYSRLLPLSISAANPRNSISSTLEVFPVPRKPTTEDEFMIPKSDYESLLGLSDIQAVRVKHCWGAKAVTLTFPQGEQVAPLKVSYSGDCRPSRDFAMIGKNSTVLIHEATFDDELRGDAKAKKHSTTSEALDVGVRMEAKAVVLTHFSQRYQKIPVLETVEDGDGEEVLGSDDAVVEEGEEGMEDQDAAMVDDAVATAPPSVPGDGHPEGLVEFPEKLNLDPAKPNNEQVVKVRSKDMKVAIAFDYMRVKIGEIAQLEKFTPALSKLFVETEKEDVDGEKKEGKAPKKGKKNGNGDGGEEGGKKKKARRNN